MREAAVSQLHSTNAPMIEKPGLDPLDVILSSLLSSFTEYGANSGSLDRDKGRLQSQWEHSEASSEGRWGRNGQRVEWPFRRGRTGGQRYAAYSYHFVTLKTLTEKGTVLL